MSARSIEKEFVVMSPQKQASIEPVDASLYERLARNYSSFHGYELIACYTFDSNWSTWEIHPHGDEIIMVLSGAATVVLQQKSGTNYIQLEHLGDYTIVPQDIWHTVKTDVKTKLLFITPGKGTRNKKI